MGSPEAAMPTLKDNDATKPNDFTLCLLLAIPAAPVRGRETCGLARLYRSLARAEDAGRPRNVRRKGAILFGVSDLNHADYHNKGAAQAEALL